MTEDGAIDIASETVAPWAAALGASSTVIEIGRERGGWVAIVRSGFHGPTLKAGPSVLVSLLFLELAARAREGIYQLTIATEERKETNNGRGSL